MRIQIDGVETLNKGAELMLYAILDQIEEKIPSATVVLNSTWIDNFRTIDTSLALELPWRLRPREARYLRGGLKLMHLPYNYFTQFHVMSNIDVVLDASGFRLGDQWNYEDKYYDKMERYYAKLKKNGTKIIFLPQSFGPFEVYPSHRSIEILNRYADLIIARESISKDNLIKSGIISSKVCMFPDFTNNISGVLPPQYTHDDFKNRICIIPNQKMVTHSSLGANMYIDSLVNIIKTIKSKDLDVFLLNHEAIGDRLLCQKINKSFDNSLLFLDRLKAKEVKGVIGASYFVFSSRFHGVASALNQSIPCLSTGWSHKYELLFKDYGLDNQVVNFKENDYIKKIEELIDPVKNENMRLFLKTKNTELKAMTSEMWNTVWTTLGI